MNRKLATIALAIALASPLSTAKAVGKTTYDVCGGSYSSWSGFAFCASVQVTVIQKSLNVWNVAIQIANMSGYNGSFAGSIFTQIGIDNIPGHLANPAQIDVAQNGAPVCTNKWNDPGSNVECWNVREDVNASGGFNVDFLGSSNGPGKSIASSCGNTRALLSTCYAAYPVTVSFDITANFNPVTQGQLYLYASAGSLFSECETGSSVVVSEQCTGSTFTSPPPVTVTPEPASLVLMGSGLFGVGGQAALRRLRRRKQPTKHDTV